MNIVKLCARYFIHFIDLTRDQLKRATMLRATVSWRSPFRGLTTVRLRCNLPTCSPPCRSRPRFRPAYSDFYIRAFGGLVTRTAAGHHYSGNWANSTGGARRFAPDRTPTSIAATQKRTSRALNDQGYIDGNRPDPTGPHPNADRVQLLRGNILVRTSAASF